MELRGWKKIDLNQKYSNTCVATGYEWLLRYNKLENSFDGIKDFQKEYNLEKKNCFPNVQNAIVRTMSKRRDNINFVFKNIKIKSFPTTKEGWDERLVQIRKLLKTSTGCILPVPVPGIGWHIMPIIKLEKEHVWLLRENYAGIIRMDILELKRLRRYFLNEEGGEDLAWIEKDDSKKSVVKKKKQNTGTSEESP